MLINKFKPLLKKKLFKPRSFDKDRWPSSPKYVRFMSFYFLPLRDLQ